MAPLNDLIYAFLITFKDSLDTAIPSISHPTLHSPFKSHFLSVVTKEDPLDPPFNDDPRPYFFHINIYIVDGVTSFIGGDLKPFRRQ